MENVAAKKQLNRAIKRAINILDRPKGACKIIRINDPNCPFHIEYCRYKEVRKIRVTIKSISKEDVSLCQEWHLNETVFTKEIWCTEANGYGFIYKEIKEI